MQGVSLAWLCSDEPRTESSGLAPNDPAVKHWDISISVGDATCQQNADGEMKGIQKERLSDYFKFIGVTEGGRTPMRGVPLWGCLSNFKLYFKLLSALSQCPVVCLFVFLHTNVCLDQPVCPSVCLSAWLSVCSPAHVPFVFQFVAMPPTPQPTDDVDIYFETPADDKEHSRFQRAKEQLEIRHRNRMERVSHWLESGRCCYATALIKETKDWFAVCDVQHNCIKQIINGLLKRNASRTLLKQGTSWAESYCPLLMFPFR